MKRKAFILSILTISMFLIMSNSVFAYKLLGGKQKTTNLTVKLKDTIIFEETNTGAEYDVLVKNSVSDWDNATSLSFSTTTTGGGEIYVGGSDFGNTGWNAQNTNYREYIWWGDYSNSVIDLNFYHMDSRPDIYNKSTISHEIGHSLGLDHVEETDQIMHTYGNPTRTVYTPQSDDIAGVEYLY